MVLGSWVILAGVPPTEIWSLHHGRRSVDGVIIVCIAGVHGRQSIGGVCFVSSGVHHGLRRAGGGRRVLRPRHGHHHEPAAQVRWRTLYEYAPSKLTPANDTRHGYSHEPASQVRLHRPDEYAASTLIPPTLSRASSSNGAHAAAHAIRMPHRSHRPR